MTLGLRKLVVLVLVGSVFLLANIMIVAHWLRRSGVIEGAAAIHRFCPLMQRSMRMPTSPGICRSTVLR